MAVTNSNNLVTSHGNVLLIDPNMVNVNPNMINSIPQYQNMYIFAELTAKRKMRTVLETSAKGTTTIQDNGMAGNDFIVNFIGNNQDSTDANPNYLKFTTNWYDGSTGNKTQFEGFGISSIKVVINSSYIPQVNIEFIDLRGLAFFNQTNSPYRILFDFPPPIFELKLKGYYGMPLLYKLHLVKYTSEFKSETGNYVISAQFVALTYAPLTDVLFRYVINFPLISSGSVSITPSAEVKPKNTYELILKLKNLYTQFNEKKNTDVDTQVYNNILSQLNAIDAALGILNGYAVNPGLMKIGKPVLLVRNMSYATDGGQELTVLNSLSEYDGYLKALPNDGTADNIFQRLYIVYLISNAMTIPNEELPGNPNADTNFRRTTANNALSKYRQDELINRTNQTLGKVINENDIPTPNSNGFTSNQNIAPTDPTITNLYSGLDVTSFYVKLYKQRTDLGKQKVEAMSVMNEKINNMVIESLGMKPTIYNIFQLILNDVDTFFKELRTTSDAAERHHKTYFDKIVNGAGYSDTGKGVSKQIFAFPLVIKDEPVCNSMKQSRTAPTDLNKALYPNEFPELVLVRNFIETFIKQQIITELLNMKAEQNADGTYKWIPISPVDSKLATINLDTPYYGVDTSGGGAGPQPINLSTDPRLAQVFRILVNRFYILSQSSFPYDFYNIKQGQTQLLKMFSQSESINLASSITNKDYAALLSNAAQEYGTKGRIQGFYDYLSGNTKDIYSFTPTEKPSLRISNGDLVYVDKKNSQYKGFAMYNDSVVTQDNTGGGNNPISNYQKSINLGWWEKFKNFGNPLQSFYKFTEENVFYIKDGSVDGSDNYGGISTKSRFIAKTVDAYVAKVKDDYKQYQLILRNVGDLGTNIGKIYNRIEVVDMLKAQGNAAFNDNKIQAPIEIGSEKLNAFGEIVDVWVDQLSRYDTEIYSTIIDGFGDTVNPDFKPRLSALMLASNFGYTLSPFNIYPHGLNKYVFNTPAVVEIPSYMPYYVGALCDIEAPYQQEIYDFFVSGSGKNLDSSAAFIFADITDTKNLLSEKDKAEFKVQFSFFFGNNGEISTPFARISTPFARIIQQLKMLYDKAQQAVIDIPADKKGKIIQLKREAYLKGLNASDGTFFKTILQPLIVNSTTSAKSNMVNFSQITFSRNLTYDVGYQSLATTNATDKKNTNDNFFKGLFQQLATDIQTQQTKIANKEEENKKLSGDDDIINQTYYSLKNINDKWLTNPAEMNISQGYPFNTAKAPRLIDSFVFVDRAMNPIGNTIINPEILIELMNDPNVSVFSVISQLLSANGFEFFPLQNFMSFQNDEWKNSFMITTDITITPSPAFVCMYIGGSSSYPTGIGAMGQYVDDGIVDISVPGVKDFSTPQEGCDLVPTDDAQEENNRKNKNFKYREVRAFRVRFGEQNQSMFKDIKIDSKEHPETNESIQILSRLAGDNKLHAPPPKGQNLYNLYENRSYKATVIGLGNMMLQPTQYFQLENIPLYNGAYILLSVEHNVEPNKMTTTFSGTKILKYPVPRTLQSSAIVGFDGGNSDLTNPAASSAEEVTIGVGTAGNPTQSQYNSMYSFKIQ
jgi:hypothetical protein